MTPKTMTLTITDVDSIALVDALHRNNEQMGSLKNRSARAGGEIAQRIIESAVRIITRNDALIKQIQEAEKTAK
jgi:hypothetical protein